MVFTKKNRLAFVTVAAVLLSHNMVTGKENLGSVANALDNCPGAVLPIRLKDINISWANKKTVSILKFTLVVEKDTHVKSYSVKAYKDALIPAPLVSTKFDDFCQEVEKNDKIYTRFLFRSGEFPRTCDFKQGKYPVTVRVEGYVTVPVAPPGLKGDLNVNSVWFGGDDKPVLCINGRTTILAIRT